MARGALAAFSKARSEGRGEWEVGSGEKWGEGSRQGRAGTPPPIADSQKTADFRRFTPSPENQHLSEVIQEPLPS